MADDYTLMTTDSMNLLLNDKGCCVRHPHIKLKEHDANGDVYMKERCPECQGEFEQMQEELREKRRQLDLQLQGLNEDDDQNIPPNGRMVPQQPTKTQDRSESLTTQMQYLQDMQEFLLFQKEKEVQDLRHKVDLQQKELLENQIEIALLKERMTHQKEQFDRELRRVKELAAVEGDERMAQQASGNKVDEIFIERLLVTGGGEDDFSEIMNQTAIQTLQAQLEQKHLGTKITIAEPSTASHLQKAPLSSSSGPSSTKETESSNSTSVKSDDDGPGTINKPKADLTELAALVGAATTMAAAAPFQQLPMSKFESNGELPVTLGETTDSGTEEMKEEDWKQRAEIRLVPDPKDAWEETAIKVVDDVGDVQDDEPTITEVDNIGGVPRGYDTVTGAEDDVESEKDDQFDSSGLIGGAGVPPVTFPVGRKHPPAPYKPKSDPLTTPTGPPAHANANRRDPMRASEISLKPPGLQDPPAGLPQSYKIGSGRNLEPAKEFEINPKVPPYTEPERDIGDDNYTVSPTVASSTFGEETHHVHKVHMLDPYGDKGMYSGVVLTSTNMPHGKGTMVYDDDGRTYDGEWRYGRWHGRGRATFANGDSYVGFYKFDKRHGKGKYMWNDGRVFSGEFREDKRHGPGMFSWPDGAEFVGTFVAGQREGHGVYILADGGKYVGNWSRNRYHGYGECWWPDGRIYKGEWKNGMYHGRGKETSADGTVRHSGEWVDDEPVGESFRLEESDFHRFSSKWNRDEPESADADESVYS